MNGTVATLVALTSVTALGCSGSGDSNGEGDVIAVEGAKRTPIELSAPQIEEVSYTWEFEGDTLNGSIVVQDAPWRATVSLARAGTARINRIAMSDALQVEVVRFDVTVENRAPTGAASAGFGTTSGVLLSASAVADEDRDPLALEWRVVESPSGASASVTDLPDDEAMLISDSPGTYVVELNVDDGDGGSATSEFTVEVFQEYGPAVAVPSEFSNRRYVPALEQFVMLDSGQAAGLYDLRTNTTVAMPGLVEGDFFRDISPNGRYAVFLRQEIDDDLTVYDLQTQSVAATLNLPGVQGYVFDLALGDHGIYYILAAGSTLGAELYEHRWLEDETTTAHEFGEDELYFHFFVSSATQQVVVFSGDTQLTNYTALSTASGPFSLTGTGPSAWTPPNDPFSVRLLADGNVITPSGRLASLSTNPPQFLQTTPLLFGASRESFAQSGDFIATVGEQFSIYDAQFQSVSSVDLTDWSPANVIAVDGGFVLFQDNAGTVRSAFIPTPPPDPTMTAARAESASFARSLCARPPARSRMNTTPVATPSKRCAASRSPTRPSRSRKP